MATENVRDYPRPPRVETTTRHLLVVIGDVTIAETRRALRVLETTHPPVYYFPPGDVRMELLSPSTRRTWCEFKGGASYWNVAAGGRAVANAAWSYPQPEPAYAAIRHHLAFYAALADACFVDGERVQAQAGSFYGGWITGDIVGA